MYKAKPKAWVSKVTLFGTQTFYHVGVEDTNIESRCVWTWWCLAWTPDISITRPWILVFRGLSIESSMHQFHYETDCLAAVVLFPVTTSWNKLLSINSWRQLPVYSDLAMLYWNNHMETRGSYNEWFSVMTISTTWPCSEESVCGWEEMQV